MGGFQAVASGLGEAGEQTGQGINNAINEALKVRQQTHLEDVDKAHITLAQQAQQQAYIVAQQQHELMRAQILQAGWKDMGATVGSDGKYARNFYNEQSKEQRSIPMNGTPPDSMENMLNHYKTLSGLKDENDNPLFTPMQAKQVAFKMPQLYREGPVGMLEGFTDYAKEKGDAGIKAIKVPGFGTVDITTPQGQAHFGQTMMDTIYQRSLMAAMYRTQNVDHTGWTANDKREFDAVANQNKIMEQMFLKIAETRMNSIAGMDPEAQKAMQKELMDNVLPLYKQTQEKEDEINARHNKTANLPMQGVKWSRSGWQAANPGKNVEEAAAEAKKRGATVVP